MGKIPKNPNQGINGLGVSIMALVMLLLLLPFATVGMSEIAKYLSKEDGDYHNWTNGSPRSNPPEWNLGSEITTQMGHTSSDTFYSSKWLRSGNYGACSETGDRDHTFGSITSSSSAYNGTSFDTCRYYHSTAEFASEYWSLMYTCGEMQQTSSECGDDRYSLAISDYKMDYTKSITRFSYQALGLQLQTPCNGTTNSPLLGNISFDYSISIQVWTPVVTTSTAGYHTVQAYHPDIWKGKMTTPNHTDNIKSGNCLLSIGLEHDLSISEQLEYSEFDFAQYENPSIGTVPIIHFIIDIDNMYDEDTRRPKSLSNIGSPFEQVMGYTSSMHFYHRFQVTELDPMAVTSSAQIVSFGIGGVLWLGAIASTPAWTPIGDKLREVRK